MRTQDDGGIVLRALVPFGDAMPGEVFLVNQQTVDAARGERSGRSLYELTVEEQIEMLGRALFEPVPHVVASATKRSETRDPCVDALHREWAHEDAIAAAGRKVIQHSRTIRGPIEP